APRSGSPRPGAGRETRIYSELDSPPPRAMPYPSVSRGVAERAAGDLLAAPAQVARADDLEAAGEGRGGRAGEAADDLQLRVHRLRPVEAEPVTGRLRQQPDRGEAHRVRRGQRHGLPGPRTEPAHVGRLGIGE